MLSKSQKRSPSMFMFQIWGVSSFYCEGLSRYLSKSPSRNRPQAFQSKAFEICRISWRKCNSVCCTFSLLFCSKLLFNNMFLLLSDSWISLLAHSRFSYNFRVGQLILFLLSIRLILIQYHNIRVLLPDSTFALLAQFICSQNIFHAYIIHFTYKAWTH